MSNSTAHSAGAAFAVAAPTMTRPADTTAYAAGDLVANDTTAGNVVPLVFEVARDRGRGVTITRARIRKSGTSVTAAGLRLHLFRSAPTVANGDNGAFSAAGSADYLGAVDVDMQTSAASTNLFSDGAAGEGAPLVGQTITAKPVVGSMVLYGLLEAAGAYTPASAETFDVTLEGYQD